MIDVTAMGELLIDFATKSTDGAGYPTLAGNPAELLVTCWLH